MESVYNDERIVDDITAQKLAAAYSAMMTALDAKNLQPLPPLPPQNTNDILQAILQEVRAIRRELQNQKRIRLEF